MYTFKRKHIEEVKPMKKPDQPIIPLTYGRDSAAAAFGVSAPLIDDWISRKDDPLPCWREGRRILIPVKEAQEWISRQVAKAAAL